MKVRTEISDVAENEIVIRCSERNQRIEELEELIKRLTVSTKREIVLYSSGAEYFIPLSEILYFESNSGKIYAHTSRAVYTTELKLFELEECLPPSFIRISKSAIANVDMIVSLRKEAVGNGQINFKNSEKMTYFSRSYYKALRNKIQKMRLG